MLAQRDSTSAPGDQTLARTCIILKCPKTYTQTEQVDYILTSSETFFAKCSSLTVLAPLERKVQ